MVNKVYMYVVLVTFICIDRYSASWITEILFPNANTVVAGDNDALI